AREELSLADSLITAIAAERPDDEVVTRELLFTVGAWAGLLRKTGDKPGAVAAYRRVADLEAARVRAHPTDGSFPDSDPNAIHNRAVALRDNGQSAEAVAALRECVTQSRQRLAVYPTDAGLRAGLAMRQMNLGILLAEAGQLEEAAAACREGADLYEAL